MNKKIKYILFIGILLGIILIFCQHTTIGEINASYFPTEKIEEMEISIYQTYLHDKSVIITDKESIKLLYNQVSKIKINPILVSKGSSEWRPRPDNTFKITFRATNGVMSIIEVKGDYHIQLKLPNQETYFLIDREGVREVYECIINNIEMENFIPYYE